MPQTQPPTGTRWRKLKSTGAMIHWTECATCGARPAPFGYANLYYCHVHRAHGEEALRAAKGKEP